MLSFFVSATTFEKFILGLIAAVGALFILTGLGSAVRGTGKAHQHFLLVFFAILAEITFLWLFGFFEVN